MSVLKKGLLIFFLIIVSFTYSDAENLLLKDGRIFKGKLVDINKKNIVLEIGDKVYNFSISHVEYLVSQVTQNSYSLLWLKRKDKSFQKVFLIKLTESALYYKNQNENELKIIKLSALDQIFLYSDIAIDIKSKDKITLNKDEVLDINSEIKVFLENLIRLKNNNRELTNTQKEEIEISAVNNPVNFNDVNFYERFWARISKYLDVNTENLLWELLEDYSEKEKSIILFYDNDEKIMKNNINDKIVELRKDFLRRSKKIILSSKM